MEGFNKISSIEAGQLFIKKYFPNCQCALLAGSVVRGEATETSDLDIVVFDKTIPSSYRESMLELGWPIEVFVHNLTSYKQYFENDCKRARPSLPRMVSEGIILRDYGIMVSIKEEATKLLSEGPEEWPDETINIKRYFITDALHDFIGCTNRAEELFVANTLAELTSEFVLRPHRRWIGASKWVIRSLNQFDEQFTVKFVDAFDRYYKEGEKDHVIQLVEDVLRPYGGQLFNGFSLGKKP